MKRFVPVWMLVVLVMAGVAVSVDAQVAPPLPLPSADHYISPEPKTGLPPSGDINFLPNKVGNGVISNTFDTTMGQVGEISNTLGCAGVGQGEFTSGLYNMPEVFGKFQQDVNSVLSKNLLSLNFVMPQTAALFDQLNTLGNQRYDQFQRACNVSAIQQDAKSQYMQACVEKLTPERKTQIETMNASNPADARIPEAQIGPMAYAQAWEICGNQYVSNTVAMDIRGEQLKGFYEAVRKVERVDQAIRPYLCTTMSNFRTADDKADNGCWMAYLIPQVRSCLGTGLEGGCTRGDYGVRQPVIPMPRLFDTFRFIVDHELVTARVVSLTDRLGDMKVDATTRRLAATEAILKMSEAVLSQNNSTALTGGILPLEPKAVVRDFQLDYLNCKNTDAMNPIKQYVDALVRRSEKVRNAGIRYTGPEYTYGLEKYNSLVDKMQLPDIGGERGDAGINLDKMAFTEMLPVAVGCTINQSIPIFDPNILVSLETQCAAEDRAAFFSMAGYDVALTATRDVYRYLGLKLKQAYARLLTESMVPVSDTTTTSVSPTISPELNAKFAAVVKDIMIPYAENQVERLNELAKTRGEFARRVGQIYKAKTGCVTGSGGGGGW